MSTAPQQPGAAESTRAPTDPSPPPGSPRLRPRRRLLAGAAIALIGALALASIAGCGSVGYVTHVASGQLRIVWDRELLDDARIAELTDDQRRALAVIRRAQAYAQEIGLRPSTSYRHIIDRTRETSVKVVVASPKDRLEPVTWWYPFVGRMTYRGYFDEARARDYAATLAEAGNDTLVRTAMMYSTLGFFDDPIPTGILEWSDVDLTDVIVHELVHGTIFVSDDIAYNESLASFIAEQACLRVFADDPERVADAERLYADGRRYTQLLADLKRDLSALYERAETPEAAIEARSEVFSRFQGEEYTSRGFETTRYDGFRTLELSNAFVVAQDTYNGDQPCLAAELEQMGGDLIAFVASHRDRPGRRAAPVTCDPIAP